MIYPLFARHIAFGCTTALLCTAVLSLPAQSDTLSNKTKWNGSQSWTYWGHAGNDKIESFGQTFEAPSSISEVNSFSFWLKANGSGGNVNYKGYIYAWDDSNKTTGTKIFESSILQAPVQNSGYNKTTVTVNSSGLVQGNSYIAIFSTNDADTATRLTNTNIRIFRVGETASGWLGSSSTQKQYQNDGTDFANTTWSYINTAFTFELDYDVVAGIAIGTDANASSPYSATFAGGRLNIDLAGIFSDDYSVGASGGSIDINSLVSILSGIFSGSGNLTISNTGSGGEIELSGINSLTGAVTVSDGATLKITGSLSDASSLTAQSGSVVGGSGSLPTSTFQSGSMHAPGNSIGESTISGNYNLNSGAQLQIEVKGPQNDKLSVTGTATIAGEVLIVPYEEGSPFPFFDYQIVDSGSNIVFNGSINQDLVTSILLSYGADLVVGNDGDPTTFDIGWLPKNGVGVVGSALTGLGINESNQKSTAGVLDSSFKNLAIAAANTSGTSGKNATGEAIGNTGFTTGQAAAAGYSSDYIQLLDDLVQLSSPGQLAAAINSLSPEPYAAFQAVGLNSLKQQRELLATHAGSCQDTGWVVSMPNTESSVPGKTGAKLPICVFADAAKSNSSINGSEGLSSYLSNSNVAYWGLEYFPSKQWTVGAAYGYGNSSLYGMSLTSAGVSSTNNSGAVYGVYKPIERLKLQTAFGYTGFSVEGTRTVSFIGNGQPINGNTSANGYTTSFDAKYDIPINTGSKKDWLVVSPIAGIAWGAYQQKGFEETGGGATDLQVNGHTSNSLVGTIGFELSTTPIKFTKSGNQSFAPKLALAYQVDALANANYTKELTASFVDAPGAGVITTQGQNGGANSFTIAAGGDLQVYENAALYATVSYEVENAGSQFGYSGGVRFLF